MNKKIYKRYNQIKKEISALKKEQEDNQKLLSVAFLKRDLKTIKECQKKSNKIDFLIGMKETIQTELLLPRFVIIGNGLELAKHWGESFSNFVRYFLKETYGCVPFDFQATTKEDNLIISRIRWHKNQIIKEDIKDLKKGKIINNDFVTVLGDIVFTHKYLISLKFNRCHFNAYDRKHLIKVLEDNYLM